MKTIAELFALSPGPTREDMLKDILRHVQCGSMSVEQASEQIKGMILASVQTALDCKALTSLPRTVDEGNGFMTGDTGRWLTE